tara:strand:+ start:1201 stop:1917 length:717 start_codon:yes stop_codon:yes gene_type:complete
MHQLGTVLGAVASTRTQKASDIERKVLALGEKAKAEGWGCEDAIIPQNISGDELISSLRNQGMPQRIIDNVNSDLVKTLCVDAVKEFLKSPKEAWCLVLSGPKGCGKSTAAAHYLCEKTKSLIAAPPRNMQWWTASRVARVSGYDSHLEEMMKVPTMVIDDLGVEYMDKNKYFSHRLDELIDERYSNYRQTIITTNLNAKDFQTRYGERVSSRIKEGFKYGSPSKGSWFIHVNEKSLR